MNGELKLKWLLNCMLLCGLAATPAYSQRGVGDAEGIARQTVKPDVVSLEGTVAEIRIAKCEKTTGPSLIGAHVLVTTEDGTVLNVHLGPADAVRDVTNQLVPGQAVAIKAFRTAKLPEDDYVAQSLTIDGSSIELRDENLRPVWAGSGQVARSPGRGPGRGPGQGQGLGLGQGNRACPAGRGGPGQGLGRGGGQGCGRAAIAVNSTPLSAAEAAGLLKLREEEKLAHDVYVALAARWEIPVFTNISQAEARHMDAMARLLQTYSLRDPVADRPAGQFSDPEVATLYDDLVAAGSESLIEAFKVGALIEEMDISDLRQVQADTRRPNIERVYQNLERASRNHLRAFAGQLNARGGSYVATHLPQDEFDAIAESPRERGPAARSGGRGNGPGWGKGQSGAGRGQGGPGRGAAVAPDDDAGYGGGFGQARGRGSGVGAGLGRGYGNGNGNGPGRGGGAGRR